MSGLGWCYEQYQQCVSPSSKMMIVAYRGYCCDLRPRFSQYRDHRYCLTLVLRLATSSLTCALHLWQASMQCCRILNSFASSGGQQYRTRVIIRHRPRLKLRLLSIINPRSPQIQTLYYRGLNKYVLFLRVPYDKSIFIYIKTLCCLLEHRH